ncbi:hypothetical protein ACWN8V_08585 [Vagococcus elongatus]|uniref:hypothetical protein n=1 Tax=Vagococcus elongatus TaxID=180344 RepID=UPI000F865882|nr:hypothetical protein [Vagococcus elongatus]
MSHHHCIRTSLNLEDENITFEKQFCQEVDIKGLTSLLYFATLSCTPLIAPTVGVLMKTFLSLNTGS